MESGELVERLYKQLLKKYPFADARQLIQQRLAKYRQLRCSSTIPTVASPMNSRESLKPEAKGENNQHLKPSQHSETSRPVSQGGASSPAERPSLTVSPGHSREPSGTCGHQETAPITTDYCSSLESITLVAKHPEYASIDSRVRSYSSWPSPSIQAPQGLAETGFYYTGRDDRVRCFACDGGLCNWAREDVPWYEHSKWYPNCPYVRDCQRHPVVAAIVDTARTIDNIQQATSSFHQQGHNEQHRHQGEVQCDIKPCQQPADIQVEEKTATQTPVTANIPAGEIDVMSLKKENEEIRSSRMCKVCMEAAVAIMFLPCSHLVCCLDCGFQLDTCPICRAAIKATTRVYA